MDELGELARAAHEEVRNQNVMLDSLGNKIDAVHEHVSNINEKLKTTLEKVRVAYFFFIIYSKKNTLSFFS